MAEPAFSRVMVDELKAAKIALPENKRKAAGIVSKVYSGQPHIFRQLKGTGQACPEYLAPEPTQDEEQDADAVAAKAEQHAGELRALGEREWHRNHPFWVREEWEDKEIFLTEKAALLYMRANAHHLNEPRTYVKHFWRNSQMETVFRALEELVWR